MADVNRDYLIAGEDVAVDSLAPVEPGDVGTELRAARQARRIDISKVATDLKIREDFLLAIENARYGDLPGIPYAIGYVRTYATYLGLDSEDLVARFKDETQGLHNEPDLAFLTPVKEGRLGGPALIGLSLALAGLAYGGWYYYSHSADDTTVAVTAKPGNLAKPGNQAKPGDQTKVAAVAPKAQAPDTTPRAEKTPEALAPSTRSTEPKAPDVKPEDAKTQDTKTTDAKPPVTKTAADTTGRLTATLTAAAGARLRAPAPPKPIVVLTGSISAKAAPEVQTAANNAAAPRRAAPKPGTRAVPASAPQPKILLKATGLTWVRIQDRSGKIVLSRVLRRGTSLEVPSRAGLTLHVGRANRLEVMVGSKVVPAMHHESLPLYNVSLDPEALLKRH